MRKINRSTRKVIGDKRSGVALLVVLLLTGLAATYAYAALRIQTIQYAIVRNCLLEAAARQAAVTGLFLALKQMHHSWWPGVDATYSAAIDEGTEVTASYLCGDPLLTSTDPRFAEYPYRVRIELTAQAQMPETPGLRSVKRLAMVVRLVPRQVGPPPTGWSDLTAYTVCQWQAGTCRLQTPFRAEGPVRFREKLELADLIDWSTAARWDWCWGLRLLVWQGQGDFRPFRDTVYLPFSRQASGTLSLLTQALGVVVVDTGVSATYSWVTLPLAFRYRLFAGGKLYEIPASSADSFQATSILPNPVVNPLGILLQTASTELLGDVRIEGTVLLAGGNSVLRIRGVNNRLAAPVFPPYPASVSGEELRVRLPAVVAEKTVVIDSGGQLSGVGLILAAKEFTVAKAGQDAPSLIWEGNIAAVDFRIDPRTEWELPEKTWTQLHSAFRIQSAWGDPIFPRWLEDNAGLRFRPNIVIRPLSDGVATHWLASDQALFIPHPADTTPLESGLAGLKWEVIRLQSLSVP